MPSFSAIPWHTDIYFVKSEVQIGTNPAYVQVGPVQQLMAVPYALHARTIPPTIRYLTTSGTYNPPSGVSYLKIMMVGGGGGGEGTTGAGGNGGATTFGSSLLICNGGNGGGNNSLGGTASLNPSVPGFAFSGNPGAVNVMGFSGPGLGGNGGASFFGGSGRGGNNSAGTSADANSGSGGGGCGNGSPGFNGGRGGGAGGFIQAYIYSPAPSYIYIIGSAGTGGVNSGGAGGGGLIVIEEYY